MKSKKTVFLLVILCLIVSVIFYSCKKNEDDNNTEGFTFAKQGDEYVVTGYTGISEVTIPSEYNNKQVTGIAREAFYRSNVSKVIISDGIKTISDGAFSECSGLYYISIPKSVTAIGQNVFYLCSTLSNIEVSQDNAKFKSIDGNLYTKNGKTLLYYCLGNGLTEFSVPEGTEKLNTSVFYSSIIEKITLPSTLKEILEGAFTRSSIKEFIVSEQNSVFSSEDGILYSDNQTTLYSYPAGKEEIDNYQLSSQIKTIHEYAFADSDIKKISLNQGLEKIGKEAFLRSKITEISIPSTVDSIDSSIFLGCSGLLNIEVADTNEFYQDIGGNLYNKAGTEFISYALGKQNQSFEIPRGVITIAKNAFYDVSYLKEIEIPDTVIEIKDYALNSSTIQKIIIDSSIPPVIGENTFASTSSYTIYVPDNSGETYKSYNEKWENQKDKIREFYEL